jgi:hypothetical protein
VVDGIFRRASMAENYVIKAKALDQPHIHGFFRTPFNGPLHKNVETLE